LYEVSRRVVEVDGQDTLPEGRLVFTWPYIGPQQDKNADAEYWLKLLAAGVTSVPEVRRNLFHESPEQLAEWMTEAEMYTAATSPIAPPVIPSPIAIVEQQLEETVEA